MNAIINTSSVTDRSGELPIVTYSNPVSTVIRIHPPAPTMTRYFYRLTCNCCNCCQCCFCSCDCCDHDDC